MNLYHDTYLRTKVGLVCACLITLAATESQGQTYHGGPVYSTPAAVYFGSAQGNNRQMMTPQQAAISQPVQLTGNKPFQDIQHAPTVSPYLSMDLLETGTSLPNYYAYVRPQLQQMETNQRQAEEIRRLKKQVRMSNGQGSLNKNQNEGMPTTGGNKQFMNLGNYFPGR
ncbi:hypothetical protein [Bythopirellula goksoeyrii]|uniref:Uncharacterized protein n=1 Tax=Bythopirellula goksoeyrii TaxID=1400387 RepID=A0A5B9QLZ5_9BACT|nr:hypothetical protein [Bythopirellula goksoeyrii]QEG38026.1 hypothetical protein Pr1d_53740 [Bythopirellula goksoeyrii]